MKKNIFIIVSIALSSLFFVGCSKDFAELNKSKTAVTTPDASRLFYEAVVKFEPQGYLEWYYNAPMMYTWSQWGVPTGGYTASFTTTTETGDKGSKAMDVLRYVNEIKDYIDHLESDDDKALNLSYYYATRVLAIYLGIFDSDLYGSRAYSEAATYKFGGPLTPKYETQEELFDLWLTQLDECIAGFTADNAVMTGSQDVIYGGNLKNWAKFANSLKLRIAVRLLSQNKSKAQSIASAVASAACGYIATEDDAVLFNKATVSNDKDIVYHWNNGFMTGIGANANVVDFMVDNLDPRVRFFYTKNQWSSNIIQAYYDRGKAIPAFIEEDVEFSVGEDGKKKFEGFKAPGEPWVRYHGLPADFEAGMPKTPNYNEWMFDAGHFPIYKMQDGKERTDGQKSYRPWSYFNLMLVNGRTYNASSFFATTPDDVHAISSVDREWYGLYMGAGEVNLYLAEFALYNGGNLGGKSAEDYYKAGVTASVKEYDELCRLNKVMYYGTTYEYDPEEVKIDLVTNDKDASKDEISVMLSHADYQLTGSNAEKLEKVFLQELINFTMNPNESFVTARRSGYPKFGSTLIPRINFSQVPVTEIPRRFDTGMPEKTDIMYDILLKAYQDQGFTPTSRGENGATLHNERVWYDKGAPEWGAGSNL